MARAFIVVLVLALGASCGNERPAEGTREIVGLVVDIQTGTGFGKIDSFTVKDGQQEYEIFVDPDSTYDFPLAHLNSHRIGAEPVRVKAELREGRLVAIEIGDA